MGLYDREYMRESDRPRSVSRFVVILTLLISLIGATSYLLKEFRLFSKSKPKSAVHQPTKHEMLLEIFPLDLNTATRTELELLPHVSKEMANDIIAARPLLTIEQLENVYDIGPKTIATIRPHVFVDAATLKEHFPDYTLSLIHI